MTTAEQHRPRPLVEQSAIDDATDQARRAAWPAGAAITFEDLEAAGREGALDALRAAEPVSWVPALGGWLVTTWHGARQVLASRSATVEAQQNLVRASLGLMMLTTDNEEHLRLRKPFNAPFKHGNAAHAFAGVIDAEAARLLDVIAPAGEAEIGEAFAAPFAVRMAGRLLGISLADIDRVNGFYSAFAAAMVYDGDPEPQRLADQARAELNAILHAEVEQTRRQRDHSITSVVANSDVDLSDDEIVAQLRVIMFGAIETIQASIMNTLLLLLQDPGQLDAARGDADLLAAAGEEACRLIPPVSFVERWTREPLTIDGVVIPANEFVGVSVVAANRDPAVFDDPTRFDIARPNASRALTFSAGPHTCLGLHVARLETSGALAAIVERLPNLRLVAHEPPSGFAFRRPASLRISWDTGAGRRGG